MTKDEKDFIIQTMNVTMIQPQESMTLGEMKAYLNGFEDARNAMFDSVDACYRNTKTD